MATLTQAIFAKKRTTKEGKTFYSFLTTMKKKDGSEEIAQVKFRDKCGSPDPEKCPINIVFDKANANMSRREYVREDTGEIVDQLTMWVSAWEEGEPYIDTSMDDYI